MGRPDERGLLAIRAFWRMEMQPVEVENVTTLLAGLPDAKGMQPILKLAAAGRELVYQRRFLDRTAELVREGELQLGSHHEALMLNKLRKRIQGLVGLIEEHVGSFREEKPFRESGARETFLVEIAVDQRRQAEWLIDLAHQASDAPEPVELIGRMMLRAAREDLLEVERFVDKLATELQGGPLYDLSLEAARGCGEMAEAIRGTLPAVPRASQATE